MLSNQWRQQRSLPQLWVQAKVTICGTLNECPYFFYMNKKEFQKLPISTGLVLLWLVYRDIKPMATLSTDFDWSESSEADINKTNLEQETQLTKALDRMGIFYSLSKRFANTIHVSKDKKILAENEKMELLDTQDAHFKRGVFYGFGEELSSVYASEVIKPGEMFPNDKLIHATMVPELVDQYWYPYIEYLVRRGHEMEDSMIAKRWAEIIRKELPQLAKEYESNRLSDLNKFKETLTQVYKTT